MHVVGARPSLSLEIPGRPPSVNHLYTNTLIRTGAGAYRSKAKADGVSEYQAVARMITRLAITKEFRAALEAHRGYIRMGYWFHLKSDMDCSNAFKALEDGIAAGLGIDDRRFLPCATGKTIDRKAEERTIVEVSFE